MGRYLKLTVGNVAEGYKTIELAFDGGEASYKILRNKLFSVDKDQQITVTVPDEWLDELDALNIFAWDKIYSGSSGGEQWELLYKVGDKVYHGRGVDAHPDDWDDLLDLIDELVEGLGFIDDDRIDAITMNYTRDTDAGKQIYETLTANRYSDVLKLKKNSSEHTYHLSAEDMKRFFDICQSYFTDIEIGDYNPACRAKIHVNLVLHDESEIDMSTDYNEAGLPDISRFAEMIHAFAPDLDAELFTPAPAQIQASDGGKFILCKVKFEGSYKPYTYRAEDETLAVGDEVDVPVGKNNDVSQARIIEIGYFDEYELPMPLDRIKTIIGKHIATDWENS